jgi:quercetin dioxygenase-like cupin family protein
VQPYQVLFESLPWVEPAPGLRFKVYRHSGKQLRLAEFAKEFVEPDWCTNGHVGYLLEGQLEIDFGGRTTVFNPGDGILIPPGEEHKHMAKALTDVARLVLVEEL